MPDGLYETDFHAWARAQAAALRTAGARRVNAPIDWENVAEEIESMGKEQAYALESALMRALEHLAKLEHSPAADPRRGWRLSVVRQRLEIEDRLRRNPSLKADLAAMLADAWGGARSLAAQALADHDGIDPASLPVTCPYTLDQVQ